MIPGDNSPVYTSLELTSVSNDPWIVRQGKCSPVDTQHVAVLQKWKVERQRGDARGKAKNQISSAFCNAPEGRLREPTSDGVP